MKSLKETLHKETSDEALLLRRPIVSVLMLAYNHEPYLAQAIESVLAQETTFPYELLIGEDCSTDKTLLVALSYQRKVPERVRVIAWNANVGMQRNHNHLIDLARGEFIAFCEGDDYWLGKNKLQQQVDFMRSHPECGLVHGNYLNLIQIAGAWRVRVAFRSQSQLRFRSGDIYAAMLEANRIQTCTVLCRRGIAAEYRRSRPAAEQYLVGDWPLGLYFAHESTIGFMKHPIAAYRRTPGSVMNSGSRAALHRGLDAIRMIGEEKYRMWLLYLGGVAMALQDGSARIFQTVASKQVQRGHSGMPPTREHLYAIDSPRRLPRVA